MSNETTVAMLMELHLDRYTLLGLAQTLREIALEAPPEWRADMKPESGALLMERLAELADHG